MTPISLLWPNSVKHEKIHLVVCDAYVEGRKVIEYFVYKKLIHLTCLVNGFHRNRENQGQTVLLSILL